MFLSSVGITVLQALSGSSQSISFTKTTQMAEEWKRKPITDIVVVKGKQA
jgi:hypothetical protein